jgi:CRISPR-associated protein Cmr6
MTFTYPLPQDTRRIFEGIQCRCTNLSLWLDRYIGYKQNWQLQEEQKIENFKKIAQNFQFDNDLIQHYYHRWQEKFKFLPHKTFKASPEWRIVVGLGQTSILETSMTLDRITGIPIIPGSALKGLAASYAMLCDPEISKLAYNSDTEKIERIKAEENPHFKAIFGSEGEAGQIIFFDAVPIEAPKLEPDIMNNHYQEYYSDKTVSQAPTPYQNPVPVYFLTLGKKTQFAFAVVGRDNQSETKELVKQAEIWLKAGLSELGIGAKTFAGYGYMTLI